MRSKCHLPSIAQSFLYLILYISYFVLYMSCYSSFTITEEQTFNIAASLFCQWYLLVFLPKEPFSQHLRCLRLLKGQPIVSPLIPIHINITFSPRHDIRHCHEPVSHIMLVSELATVHSPLQHLGRPHNLHQHHLLKLIHSQVLLRQWHTIH